MSKRPEHLPEMTPERLSEIESLLTYESSVSFQSGRAHESMWMLVAEVQRCAQDSRDMLAELWRLREQQAESYEEGWRDGHRCAERCSDVPCPAEERAEQAVTAVGRAEALAAEWERLGRGDGVHGRQLRAAINGRDGDA